MKIRKIGLTIASALMMVGSAAAIAPAHAETVSDYTKYFTGEQFASWKSRTEGCTSLYGEQYREDCEYYSVAMEYYEFYYQEGDQEEYERYGARAGEIWGKLFDLTYGKNSAMG
ncbi:Uncharacterised protein [Corynebacterium kutscheri]|uniref:Uncharacterized protein n=1 Tax=Corynebacterium kutscheri TaxID=35755 RepID=A0A0F6R1B6_9CORY|nr:hypothetical protein [Corynebacterium kutscheri]AKE42232.1 hypothetical protein UL82_10490 [Corynebacterium kutscheri]VEH05711.1 Uncharacterised protein [Corynebacterium kutscheri]VEH10575.1 Uncharacterised protein [Corynebacterium kutscheri]VEH81607.1 Uncharacterised protein [Corynebacterium kutscheri]